MYKLMVVVAVLAGVARALIAADEPASSFEVPAPAALALPPKAGQAIRVEGLTIAPGIAVDLELQRVELAAPSARFVVHSGGVDRPLAYDTSRVVLLSGEVASRPGSRAFLARSPSMGWVGRVDDGGGREASIESSRTEGGPSLTRLRITPGPVRIGGGLGLGCGVDTSTWVEPESGDAGLPADFLVEVAVDTDFDYYELFDNTDRAMDYLFVLYGQVSHIFARDSGIRVTLSFTRLWTDPDDLFNGSNPLGEFRTHWNANMAGVHRDTAQFCSGRRDFPFGGSAFLPGVCDLNNAYSCIGYVAGESGDLDTPSRFNGDVIVAAHELGHNFGAPHTHDRALDECDDAFAQPQRGSIMSYCGQSYSGGDANHDPRFHTDCTRLMRALLANRSCDATDCNGNGVPDSTDISAATSADANGNGRPDECEDCNDNNLFDDLEITFGLSLDLNANGKPDECEPDCNANDVPDDLDIALGDEQDLDANGVPDSCQADCDGNGVADVLDINADMSLDRNRNALLDGCEDCDNDGVADIIALDQEHNIWIGSLEHDESIREFFGGTGVLTRIGEPSSIETVNDLVITTDRRVLVASATDDRIVEFAADGSLIGDLVPGGSGGLDEPAGMLMTPSTLLVSSRLGAQVLEYDLTTGAFIRVLASLAAQPFGLAHAPDGGVLIALDSNTVVEHDIATGAFRRAVVSEADNGGLSAPRGLVVDTLGRLLVCSYSTNEVLAYNLLTGAPLGQFNRNGTADRLTLEEPWTIRVGPNRNVFVSNSHIHQDRLPAALHLTQTRVYEFDYHFGNYVRSLIQGADTDLWHPSGFDFMPGGTIDCNLNFFPDSCELALGLAQDVNGDGVPDDCQVCRADLSGDGLANTNDFFLFLAFYQASDARADLTGSSDPASRAFGVPDGQLNTEDFFAFLQFYQAGCP